MTNRSIFPPWAIDRHTQIVIRSRQAVHLGYIQFAIFRELHEMGRQATYRLPSQKLADRVYIGGKNPKTLSTIHVIVQQANRKLAHLKLKIRGVNRGYNSFYQIVPLDYSSSEGAVERDLRSAETSPREAFAALDK